jgi:hypothetical protein
MKVPRKLGRAARGSEHDLAPESIGGAQLARRATTGSERERNAGVILKPAPKLARANARAQQQERRPERPAADDVSIRANLDLPASPTADQRFGSVSA